MDKGSFSGCREHRTWIDILDLWSPWCFQVVVARKWVWSSATERDAT